MTDTNTTNSTMTAMTIWTARGPLTVTGGDDEPLEIELDGWPRAAYESDGFAWRRMQGRLYVCPAQDRRPGIACLSGTAPTREDLAEILGEATVAEAEAAIAGFHGASATPEYLCSLLGVALRRD